MSTQEDSGISFEISNEQQNFRLLELPPSLLALIGSRDASWYVLITRLRDSQDADMFESLWLKSADSPNANHNLKQASPSAVLCTDHLTFQLRQVQSSNSVFILRPTESHGTENGIPLPSVSAIAQCTSTLELIPSDTAASSAMLSRLLRDSLPLYNGTETDVELGTNNVSSSKITACRYQKEQLGILTFG